MPLVRAMTTPTATPTPTSTCSVELSHEHGKTTIPVTTVAATPVADAPQHEDAVIVISPSSSDVANTETESPPPSTLSPTASSDVVDVTPRAPSRSPSPSSPRRYGSPSSQYAPSRPPSPRVCVVSRRTGVAGKAPVLSLSSDDDDDADFMGAFEATAPPNSTPSSAWGPSRARAPGARAPAEIITTTTVPFAPVPAPTRTGYETQQAIHEFYAGKRLAPRSNASCVTRDPSASALLASMRPSADIRAPIPSDVAREAAMSTPTGQARRQRRPLTPRYRLLVPRVPVGGFNSPEGVMGSEATNEDDAVTQLALTRGLTDNTLADYLKKVSQHWDPFCLETGVDRMFPSVADVLQWLVWLHAPGTRKASTIQQYVLARRKIQLRFRDGLEVPNVFNDPLVHELRRSCKLRLENINYDGDLGEEVIRAPLPPTDVLAIFEWLQPNLNAAWTKLGKHTGEADEVTFEDVRNLRACIAVVIGYAWGHRASHLYDVEFTDIEMEKFPDDEPMNPAWRTLPSQAELARESRSWNSRYVSLRLHQRRNKTSAPCDVRGDGGRTMRQNPFMMALANCINNWRDVRRWHTSIHMDVAKYVETGEVISVPKPRAATQTQWDALRNALKDDMHVTQRVLCMPLESPSNDPPATITDMLHRARRTANLRPLPRPRKYTSHSIRAGAASACYLATRQYNIMCWWMRWAAGSKVPERSYLAFEWTQMSTDLLRASKYFFGWLDAFEFTTA